MGAGAGRRTNLHTWLATAGFQWADGPASLLTLAGLGWWLYRYRGVDLWLRLGVAGLVARLWSHHFRYDDVLILLPMVALFRLVARDPSAGALAHGILALTCATMLAPARLFFAPWPWPALIEAFQTTVWLAALAFLGYRAHAENRAGVERGRAV